MNHFDFFKEDFKSFLESSFRVSWVDQMDFAKIYFRKSQRYIEGVLCPCLDLATVEVEHQGQGTFTQILEWIEAENPFPFLYVENVFSSRFADFFRRRGYVEIEINSIFKDCFCFYKKTDNTN